MLAFGELSCIASFLICYILYDIYIATISIMLITTLISFVSFLKNQLTIKVAITNLIVVMLGLFTVVFKNDSFIKLKPTLLFWGLSLFLKFNIKYNQDSVSFSLLRDHFNKADKHVFKKIDYLAMWFYFLLGILNIVMAFLLTTTLWVVFKTIAILFFNTVFFIFIASRFLL